MNDPSIGRLQIARASGSIALGKYRIFASLGRGGMADVQLAAAQGPKGFNKLAVVKRLRPLLADDPGVVNMFLDEARLAARLNHPNLIHTYEFGEENGNYFIVMEFIEGQPLHEILNALQMVSPRRKVSPSIWARIVAEALAGLHYAHELRDYDGTPLNVVHRDVSPQNIVVTYDGGVKLVDFGIAKATVNASKTESKMIKGKLAYMAPEQADPVDRDPLDRRADIFAMGIVFWECLTQKRLATGDARAVVSKIIDLEFQAPSAVNPDVPAELDAIARRALERSPADRFQTAQAMREAIERFLRTQGDAVDEAAIGGLVGDLFARDHEEIQRQIRREMSDSGTPRDLTVEESTPSQRVARRLAREKAVSDAAIASPPVPSLSPSATSAAPAARSGIDSIGSLRVVRTTIGVTFEGRGGRGLAVVGAAALVAVAAAFMPRSGGDSRAIALAGSPSAAPRPFLPSVPALSGKPVLAAGVASSAEPPSPAPAEAVSPDAAASSAPPSSSAFARPPPARVVPSRPHPPAKLDEDPWR